MLLEEIFATLGAALKGGGEGGGGRGGGRPSEAATLSVESFVETGKEGFSHITMVASDGSSRGGGRQDQGAGGVMAGYFPRWVSLFIAFGSQLRYFLSIFVLAAKIKRFRREIERMFLTPCICCAETCSAKTARSNWKVNERFLSKDGKSRGSLSLCYVSDRFGKVGRDITEREHGLLRYLRKAVPPPIKVVVLGP